MTTAHGWRSYSWRVPKAPDALVGGRDVCKVFRFRVGAHAVGFAIYLGPDGARREHCEWTPAPQHLSADDIREFERERLRVLALFDSEVQP